MARRSITPAASNRNTQNEAARQARLAEAIRLTEQLGAARQAEAANSGIRYSEIHYTTDPGPDFTPRPWR